MGTKPKKPPSWRMLLSSRQSPMRAKSWLNSPDTRLLVVGYGFGDKHINQCIVNAIGKGLKLYVISPQSPQEFKNQFKPPLHGNFIQKPLG